MKQWIRCFALAVLTAALLVAAAGCSQMGLREDAVRAFNDTLKAFSGWSLTKDENLQGARSFGTDCYVGEYRADYTHFYGKETLFGGAALERVEGMSLTVDYDVTVDSGNVKLYWMAQGEERLLCTASDHQTVTLTLEMGSNYIVLEGDNLTGTVRLTVDERDEINE